MLQAQYKTFPPLTQTAFLPLMKKLGPANFKKRGLYGASIYDFFVRWRLGDRKHVLEDV